MTGPCLVSDFDRETLRLVWLGAYLPSRLASLKRLLAADYIRPRKPAPNGYEVTQAGKPWIDPFTPNTGVRLVPRWGDR
jgi:hypothetical protein